MKTCVIVIIDTDYEQQAWHRCLESVITQHVSSDSIELSVVWHGVSPFDLGVPSSVPVHSLAHPYSEQRATVMNAARRAVSGADILLFIEEPLLLPADYINAVQQHFEQPWIGAVQTRIVSERESQQRYPKPSRAGYKKFFRTPVLDGRIVAIRSSFFDDCGQFVALNGKYLWFDLSWRLMFLPGVLHMMRAVMAISLRKDDTKSFWRIVGHEAQGRAQFLLRWRAVLLPRMRRILGGLLRTYQLELIDCKSHLWSFSYGAFLLVWLRRVLIGALTLLYSARWVMRIPCIDVARHSIERLYPWGYFYSDDKATYAGRIGLKEPQFLDPLQLSLMHKLFMTRSLSHAIELLDAELIDAPHLSSDRLRAELINRDILIANKNAV
jgi:hypothetical protein